MHFENLLPLLDAWPLLLLGACALAVWRWSAKAKIMRRRERERYEAEYWRQEREYSFLMRIRKRLFDRKTKRLTYQPVNAEEDA